MAQTTAKTLFPLSEEEKIELQEKLGTTTDATSSNYLENLEVAAKSLKKVKKAAKKAARRFAKKHGLSKKAEKELRKLLKKSATPRDAELSIENF